MTYTIIDPAMSMAKIQAALNKESPCVIFNPGIYNITKQLVINSNTMIVAYDATFRRMGNLQSIFITKATAGTTGYNGAKNITFDGGTLEGVGDYSDDNLMTLFHASNVKLYNMTFKDAIGYHHLEINSSENVVVSDCRFYGYKTSDSGEAFRECIQIDFAGYSELVIAGTTPTSRCYDLTCCKDIVIVNCKFDKSESRPSCNVAIGTHTQPGCGKLHKGIYIMKCEMTSYTSLGECAINVQGWEDVHISDCEINGFKRGIRIVSTATSYESDGSKVTANASDGATKDAFIYHNIFNDPIGSYVSTGVFCSMKNGGVVDNLNIQANEFFRGTRNKKSSRAVDIYNVVGGTIHDNILNGMNIVVQSTSREVDEYANT